MIYTQLVLKFQQALQRCLFRSECMILCEGECFLRPILGVEYGCLDRFTHLVDDVHMAVPCTTRGARAI